jgi:D-galactarolactone cycloisomerase
MEITDMDAVILDNATGNQSLPSETGELSVDIRSVLLTVETDEGIRGHGESFHHSDSVLDSEMLVKSIEALGRHVVGENPLDVLERWHELYTSVKRSSAYEALSVLDQAMWDIKGKRAGVPVYELLGGATGDLHAYATFPHSKDIGDLVDDGAGLAEHGFTSIKIVAGFGVDRDRRRIEEVAAALPDSFGLAIDANTSYDFTDALAVAETASEHGVEWFEEPIAHTDIQGIADLRARTSVPIAGYQTHTTHYPAVDHLRAGAYDIYQPGLYHCGGITPAMNVATLVEAFNKRFVPHAVGPAYNYAASLHVAAASPACSLVEFAVFDDELSDPGEFVASPYVENQTDLSVRDDGTIAPPDDPGLGLGVDQDALAEFRVDG